MDAVGDACVFRGLGLEQDDSKFRVGWGMAEAVDGALGMR